MDETNHSPNPRIRHETTDINVWAVGKFAIGLVVVMVISVGLLFGLLKFFQSREATAMVTPVDPAKVFPQPQLQKTPILDLRAIRAEEDKLLTGYGWVDPQKGLVRIPVSVAIDVLAKRGLPARPATAAATAASEDPTGSSHMAPHEEPKK
jgi:cysteine synthase